MSLYGHQAGTFCGIRRMGVLQGMEEVHTGSSGRMGWEGEEQKLRSVERGGCGVQEVAYWTSWPGA